MHELSQQHRFRPSDEFTTFKIIKSLKEDLAVATALIESLEEEFLVVVPEITFVIVSLYGTNEIIKKFIDRGGNVKVISDISYSTIELVQQVLDMGEDVRHFDKYQGIIFAVFDRKTSISAINVDIRRVSLNEPLSALWTDDPTYAQYLISTFELLWKQAIPASKRIEELLDRGPPQI